MTGRDPLKPPRRPKSDAEQMPAQILILLTILAVVAAIIGALTHA